MPEYAYCYVSEYTVDYSLYYGEPTWLNENCPRTDDYYYEVSYFCEKDGYFCQWYLDDPNANVSDQT